MASKRGRCAYCGKPNVSLLEAFRPELVAEHKSDCLWVRSKGNALVPKPKPTRRRPTDSERLTAILSWGVVRVTLPGQRFEYITRRIDIDDLIRLMRREEAKK